MSIDQKNARLATLVAEMGFVKEIGGMRLDNIDAGLAFVEKREALAAQAQNHADMLQMHYDSMQQAHHDRMAQLADNPQVAAFQQFMTEHPGATSSEIQSYFRGMHAPRSGIGMAMQQYIAEHPGASSEDIGRYYANFQQEIGAGRAFSYGKQGDAIRSFSVALTHLDTIQQLGEALANGDTRRLNQIANVLKTEFGGTAVPNFEFAKQIVGAEVTKAIVGGAGSLTDRQELQSSFNSANSPEQLVGVIQTAKKLMAGQLSGYRRQYENATGLQNFDDLLSPEARQELGSLTPSTAAPPAMRYTAKNAAGVTIYSPDGQHWFNSDGSIYAK